MQKNVVWCWFLDYPDDIRRVFGKNTLYYVTNLAKRQIDFFPRLPNSLLIHVIKFLDLEDIDRLSQVSKLFKQVQPFVSIGFVSIRDVAWKKFQRV